MKVNRFEEFIVWQNAIELVGILFNVIDPIKSYWYRDQLLRAATSISSNIAEGFERESNKEFARFLFISRGSCGEVRSLIHVGVKCKFLSPEMADPILDEARKLSFLIFRLIKSLDR